MLLFSDTSNSLSDRIARGMTARFVLISGIRLDDQLVECKWNYGDLPTHATNHSGLRHREVRQVGEWPSNEHRLTERLGRCRLPFRLLEMNKTSIGSTIDERRKTKTFSFVILISGRTQSNKRTNARQLA